MQAHRPAASLQVSRRECLLAFPAAANLKGIKTSRPTDRKVHTATASAASCAAYLVPNLSAAGIQYNGQILPRGPWKVFA